MNKDFNINIKSLSKPFQYASFAFLKHNIVTFTDRRRPDWSTITRENAAKVGTHWLPSAQWTNYMHANSGSAAQWLQEGRQWYSQDIAFPPSFHPLHRVSLTLSTCPNDVCSTGDHEHVCSNLIFFLILIFLHIIPFKHCIGIYKQKAHQKLC